MKVRYVYFLILATIFSCEHKKKYTFELSKINDWSVPLDTLTSNMSFQLRIVRLKEKEYLGMYSRNLHSISLWDLNTKEKKFNIQFTKDGEDGVYRLNGFYLKNLDSIYVLPTHYKQVVLTNLNGHILKKYKFRDSVKDTKELDKIDFIGDYNVPMQIAQGKILLGTTPYENSISPNFGNMPLGFTYDLNSEMSNTHFMQFSDPYKKQPLGFFHAQYYSDLDIDGRNCIVSFSADEKIYLRDMNGKLLSENEAKSDYFNLILNPLNKSGQDVFEKYFLNNPSYGKILSDPYRKVYYRFAFQKYEGSDKVLTDMMWSYKPSSVIILNDKFQKIGETVLPLNKHFVTNAFVGEKGLYISNAHPKNPNNNENNLSFTYYSLVKKQ